MLTLRITKGPLAGQELPVEKGALLGSDRGCDLVLASDKVAREQARIVREGDDYVLHDLNRLNVMRLNGARLTAPTRLQAGDLLMLGEHVVQVSLPAAAAGAAAKGHGAAGAVSRLKLHPLFWAALVVVVGLVAVLVYHNIGTLRRQAAAAPPAPDGIPAVGGVQLVTEGPRPPGIAEEDMFETPAASREKPQTSRPAAAAATPASAAPAAPSGPRALYLWLDSKPGGATVSRDNQDLGTTPLLLEPLTPGRQTISFSAPGYETATRSFEVPNDGERQEVTLRQEKGSCLVTSEPPGAAVLYATRLLGYTPLVVRKLPVGEADLRLLLPAFEDRNLRVTIAADYPTKEHVELKPATGTLRIVTVPAGASVRVNGLARGETARAEGQPKSQPLDLAGFLADEHEVQISYAGEQSAVAKVSIFPRETTALELQLWYPDLLVQTTAGRQLRGMLVERSPAGDLTLADSKFRTLVIPAAEVKEQKPLTEAEARDLLQQARAAPKEGEKK